MAIADMCGWDWANTFDQVKTEFTVNPLNAQACDLDKTLGRNGRGVLRTSAFYNQNNYWSRTIPGGPYTEGWVGIAWKLGTAPSTMTTAIFRLVNASNAVILTLLRNATTSTLEMVRGDYPGGSPPPAYTSIEVGTTALSVSDWVYIELYFLLDGSTGAYEVRIDGVTEMSDSGVNTAGAAGGATVLRVGGAGYNSNLQCYWDDYWFDDAAFNGDLTISHGTVDADLSPTAWTPSTGATSFGVVDEANANDDTDYLSTDTDTDKTVLQAVDPALTGSAGCLAIRPMFVGRQVTAGGQGVKVGLASNGSGDQQSAKLSLTTSHRARFGDMHVVDPGTSSAWDNADLDQIELSVEYGA